MRTTSRIRIFNKELRHALGRGDELLNAHVSRLVVLYEDLRLELNGVSEETLKPLDGNGRHFRSQYFIRRAIGTVVEFAEEFRLLNDYDGFTPIREAFDEENLQRWNQCVAFYAEHESFFKQVRNDIGGHFGFTASLYAVRHFQPGATGHIKTDIDFVRNKGSTFYEFATEVAATALTAQRNEGESSEAFFRRIFALLRQGFELAVPATSTVSMHYTLDRFR